jgi:hypothetical protein
MTDQAVSLFDAAQPTIKPTAGTPKGMTLPAPAGWPAPPEDGAYHGLPGAIVAKIAPHTEADPVAILAQLLVCCGALIGRGAHFQVEATLHHPNEFVKLEQGQLEKIVLTQHNQMRAVLITPERYSQLEQHASTWGSRTLSSSQ